MLYIAINIMYVRLRIFLGYDSPLIRCNSMICLTHSWPIPSDIYIKRAMTHCRQISSATK